MVSSSFEDYNFSGMPLPNNTSTNGGQNNYSNENNASAAPKLYLGTGSGLGF
jgi:hypothetical protein